MADVDEVTQVTEQESDYQFESQSVTRMRINEYQDEQSDSEEWFLTKYDKRKKDCPVNSKNRMCVIHRFNDGRELAPPVWPLTEKSYRTIVVAAKFFLGLPGEFDSCTSREIDIAKRFQHRGLMTLNPPLSQYTRFGFHKNCIPAFSSVYHHERISQRIDRITEKLKNPKPPPSPTPVITVKKKQNPYFTKRPAKDRYNYTPESLTNRIEAECKHLNRLDHFLQTISRDREKQLGGGIVPLTLTTSHCVLCDSDTKRFRIYVSTKVPFGGRIMLAAVLKNDIVIKTRILRLLQRKMPISYHVPCCNVYCYSLIYPTAEMVSVIKELLSCLYTNNDMPAISSRFLEVHKMSRSGKKKGRRSRSELRKEKAAANIAVTAVSADENRDQIKNKDDIICDDDDANDFDQNSSETYEYNNESEMTDDKNNVHNIYSDFVKVVRARIYDKEEVLKLSTLHDVYKEMVAKNGVQDIVDFMSVDCLKVNLLETFPDLQFHSVSYLSSELVFKPEKSQLS